MLLRVIKFSVLGIFELLKFWQNLSTVAYKAVAYNKKIVYVIAVSIQPLLIASSTTTPGELRQKLQQILSVLLSSGDEECPICLDSLNQPVITHCAHLYCRPCIESVIRTDSRESAKCPMCRGNIDKDKLVEPDATKTHQDTAAVEENKWSSSSKVTLLPMLTLV